jgi:multimeric flavodoxin WrbA
VARLLAVYGSPRKGGNSSVLLDYFLEGTRDSSFETKRVYLRDLHFSPCTECGRCAKTGVCVIKDDMAPLYDKLLNYERIVISCPVFFLGPPAITKAFLDRTQALWNRKYILGINPVPEGVQKKGFLLSVCGFRGSERIFLCNRTIIKAVYASCGFSYSGELFYNGIDHFGDMKKRENAHQEAQKAGYEFVHSKL